MDSDETKQPRREINKGKGIQIEETEQDETGPDVDVTDKVGGSSARLVVHTPSVPFSVTTFIRRKLFVGGIAPETTEESLRKYFSQFGEITDSVIISNKRGSPRGYGFVTYAESEIAKEVLEEDHIIDGRAVENFLLKSTLTVIFPLITTLRLGLRLKRIFCSVYKVLVKKEVPKEDMHVKRASKTRKIFIGGLPRYYTEDDLKEHFSTYGYILRHRIMRDNYTGRSRGFGFVTFANEKAVEEVFSDGCMHELGGKQVKIERAEPIRADVEHASENWLHHGGSISKSHYGDCDSAEGFGCAYGGNTGAGHGGYGGYEGYGNYGGYGSGPTVFYPVYGGSNYVVGFGGAMYGSTGYGGSSYGAPGYYGGSTGGAMHGASGYVGSSYGTPVNYGGSTGGAMYGAAGYGGSSYGAPVNYGGSTGGAMYGAADYGGSSYGAPVYYGGSTVGAMYGAAGYGGSGYGAPVNYDGGTGYASSNRYGSTVGNPTGYDNANRYDSRGSTAGNPAGYENANRYDTGGSSGGANA
ncbi:putative nucleosome assembly protein 1-like 1-like isoform 1 [Capsicum annuum]|nr:putative nucleosome assembly protein 1-like 1-like isoform 1 [Capsicum annuum]